jgi:hypothetical protein
MVTAGTSGAAAGEPPGGAVVPDIGGSSANATLMAGLSVNNAAIATAASAVGRSPRIRSPYDRGTHITKTANRRWFHDGTRSSVTFEQSLTPRLRGKND